VDKKPAISYPFFWTSHCIPEAMVDFDAQFVFTRRSAGINSQWTRPEHQGKPSTNGTDHHENGYATGFMGFVHNPKF
jgi:hypothetical protein